MAIGKTMRRAAGAAAAAATLAATCLPGAAQAQVYVSRPGELVVDGNPVVCFGVAFVLDPSLPDVGMARPGVIVLNPQVLGTMSTSMKLFWVAHECGHHVVGSDESGSDCWAIRTGRDQGWFPPWAFDEMMYQFRNNPGSMTHAPGPERVRRMVQCYAS